MKNKQVIKRQKKTIRHARVRAKVQGTAKKPRFCVFRSLKHISVQLIDDEKGKTLFSASDKELKDSKGSKSDIAKAVGQLVAKKALEKKISQVVFDRGGNKYHGRVKAVAEAAREAGLKF